MRKAHVISKDLEGNNHTVLIEDLKWRPAVYAIIIQDDQILLSPQGGYDLPGGGVKIYETLEEALVREVKEETGYDIEVGKYIAVREIFFTNIRKKKHVHSIAMYYTARIVGGSLSDDGFKGSERDYMSLAEWIPLSTLSAIQVKNSIDWRPIVKEISNFLHPLTPSALLPSN